MSDKMCSLERDQLDVIVGGSAQRPAGLNAYVGLGDLEAPILKNCRYVRSKFQCEPGARRVREGDRFYFYRGDDAE